jgi:hypothetical protein
MHHLLLTQLLLHILLQQLNTSLLVEAEEAEVFKVVLITVRVAVRVGLELTHHLQFQEELTTQ